MSAETDTTKHRVTVLDTDESYVCGRDESLLAAMVRLGRRGIPSGCHGGGCGICKIRVDVGTYRTRIMSREHVSEEDKRAGRVLACRTYPRSDIRLKVLGKMRKSVLGRAPAPERKFGLV